MISNCEKCNLPGIVDRYRASRIALTTANANILASSSPTEVQPYQQAATIAAAALRAADAERAEFIKDWGGFCANCLFGA